MDRGHLEGDASVEVTVDVGEADAIPPDAVMAVTLADISKLDAPAETLASRVIEQIGSLPARLSVRYDPDLIIDTNSYAVRATISIGGTLAYTTDTTHAVITRGAATEVDVKLVPVGSAREH